MKRAALMLTALLATGAAQAATPFSKERQEWNAPQKPFHMIGDL